MRSACSAPDVLFPTSHITPGGSSPEWKSGTGTKSMKGAAFPVTLVSVVSFVLTSLSEIVNMNNDITEKPTAASELEVEAQPSSTGGPVYDVDLKVDYDRTGAIDAERIEHDMTVLQAVKAYPAASLWAVVMSSTIVSSCP